jgi:hypothetical protein
VALQSLKDLGRLTYRRFLELFRHMVGLLGRVISPSQGLYLHRTTQHRKTRTNIHPFSGIRTHDPSNQPVNTHASDRTATVTGCKDYIISKYTAQDTPWQLIVIQLFSKFAFVMESEIITRPQHLFQYRAN